jgi:DnaJ-class molecular chaperone
MITPHIDHPAPTGDYSQAAYTDTHPAKVKCRECNGTGQIPAGIDREAGRDPGRDCWKCHGYGEHIR